MANVWLRINGYCALVAVRSQFKYMGSRLGGGCGVAGTLLIAAGEDEPSKDLGQMVETFSSNVTDLRLKGMMCQYVEVLG